MNDVLLLISTENRAAATEAMREALERLRGRLRTAWMVEKPSSRR